MTLFLRLLASGTSKIHLLFNRLAGFIDEQLYLSVFNRLNHYRLEAGRLKSRLEAA